MLLTLSYDSYMVLVCNVVLKTFYKCVNETANLQIKYLDDPLFLFLSLLLQNKNVYFYMQIYNIMILNNKDR